MMSEWDWERRSAQSLAGRHRYLASDHEAEARRHEALGRFHRRRAELEAAMLRDHRLTRDEAIAANVAVAEMAGSFDGPDSVEWLRQQRDG